VRVLITGGCGFLGTNLADALLAGGKQVRVFDNLSRSGAERNRAWLEQRAEPARLEIFRGDVRDAAGVRAALDGCDVVIHLAGQVAVTTSVQKPLEDFEINALGTINVLEAARQARRPPVVLYASSNKVYGGLEDVRTRTTGDHYAYVDLPHGIPETQSLDFHSPYGCSKGSGDQYARDYHRIYGLPTVVFRMSCLYGPHQFGNEDQGWVAHFVISALQGVPITIFGDGKQVRDLLYVTDAVRAYTAAIENIDAVSGQVFNLGGGPANTVSLLELLNCLERALGAPVARSFASWRPGDQRVYTSDIRKLGRALGWRPSCSVSDGLRALIQWITTSGHFPTLTRTLSHQEGG
jgi:CDP-paratose 2-epimerase